MNPPHLHHRSGNRQTTELDKQAGQAPNLSNPQCLSLGWEASLGTLLGHLHGGHERLGRAAGLPKAVTRIWASLKADRGTGANRLRLPHY